MENLKNSIVWGEIPVTDFERAKKFYSAIYDYEMYTQQMGPHLMGFLPMERDSQGIGGAIVSGEGYVPSRQGSLIYLNGGKDLNVVLNRVEKAGGKVLQPKTQITPEIGYFALLIDTEGNKVALHSIE